MRKKPDMTPLTAFPNAQVLNAFVAAFLAASLVAFVGGCTSPVNVVGDPFVAPRKFQYLRCQDIDKRLVDTQKREQELRTLMDRSAAGTGGSTVNLFVYEPEYQTVSSELRQLKEAAVEKNCKPEPAKPDGNKTDARRADARRL
jgi:hypothetical protein